MQNFTTPVGRLVMGSAYKPQTTDAAGKPLTIKSGPNVGQPKVQYFFALAIPKGGEQHWSQTSWGQIVWQEAHAAFQKGQADLPTFAWKIVDGDSQIPNAAGNKPCSREGHPGNWIIHFSSGFAPKIYNKDGTAAITEADAVKLGYFIQVAGSVAGNGDAMKPGVFMNHNMVALSAYGPEIVIGPDASQAGFGNAPLPAGATAAPAAAFVPPQQATPAAYPQANGMQQLAAPAPNPAFLAVPPLPVTPPPAVPSPHVMLPAANGATYEQMIGAGWNDALLIQHGMMVA